MIGIVVAYWECDGKPRTMILIPRTINDSSYCEVEIVCHEDSTPVIVSDAITGWSSPQENGFGDNSAGYRIDVSTAEDLDLVWDDGSNKHPERSAKLYQTFSQLIDHYSESAKNYVDQWCEAKYQEDLRIGLERGFDLSLIEKKTPVFVYGIISTS